MSDHPMSPKMEQAIKDAFKELNEMTDEEFDLALKTATPSFGNLLIEGGWKPDIERPGDNMTIDRLIARLQELREKEKDNGILEADIRLIIETPEKGQWEHSLGEVFTVGRMHGKVTKVMLASEGFT